jgi:hypothetical protein
MKTESRKSRNQRASGKERGSALIVALFSLLLASLIAMGLAFTGMYEVKISRNYQTGTEAFYIAEAGLNQAVKVIMDNSLAFSDVLKGADGALGTGDDGILTLSSIPAGDRIPAAGVNFGSGNYRVLVTDGSGGAQTTLIVTATGTGANSSVSVVEARLTGGGGGGAGAAGYGGSSSYDGNLYIGGASATTLTLRGTTDIGCNVIALTNISVNGNPNIIGYVDAVGDPTHTNITVGGSANITGNARATGTISGQDRISGTSTPGYHPSPSPTIPTVNPADYTYAAITALETYDRSHYEFYTMQSNGEVWCESCPGGRVRQTMDKGKWNDWSYSSGKWTLGNKGTREGTFFVQGNAQIDNNHGNPSSRFHMSIIATGYVDIATNNDLAPSWHECGVVAGTDVALAGNASVDGWIAAHEQVDLIGGTGISAQYGHPIIVENAASVSSKVTALGLGGNTGIDCSGGTGSSSGFYGASGGSGAGTIQKVSWREVKN